MVHSSSAQTNITEFDGHYELRLDPDNRWIRLGKLLPWDEMAALHCRELSAHMDVGTVNPRHVIGAIILKHKLGPGDAEMIKLFRVGTDAHYRVGQALTMCQLAEGHTKELVPAATVPGLPVATVLFDEL